MFAFVYGWVTTPGVVDNKTVLGFFCEGASVQAFSTCQDSLARCMAERDNEERASEMEKRRGR